MPVLFIVLNLVINGIIFKIWILKIFVSVWKYSFYDDYAAMDNSFIYIYYNLIYQQYVTDVYIHAVLNIGFSVTFSVWIASENINGYFTFP